MICHEEVIFKEELKKLYTELNRCQDRSVKFDISEDINILVRALSIIRSQSQK